MAPLLDIDGLSVRYGALRALHDVTLHVAAGEVVAVLGANGAGKSTLLKAVVGLTGIEAGEVRFAGRPLPPRRPAVRAGLGIGYVPEGRRVFPGMTVVENLEVAASGNRRRRMEGIARIYRLFPRLAERERSLGWQLSGGEQQMLAIGRALMAEPKLLLLDEPSLGLSPRLLDDLFVQIRRISEAGTAILLAEQRLDHALQVAHRAYVLELGRTAMEAPASELARDEALLQAYLGV